MAMIRVNKKENPFVQLDRSFIEDTNLTFKGKGILSYILSKPDGWKVRQKDLINHTAEGRASVSSGLEELMEKGYIYKYQERAEGGHFGNWVYDVYERPEYNPKKEQGENIIKTLKQRREERKKQEENTESRKPNYGDSPKAGFPKSEKPKSEKPKSENLRYSDIELSDIYFSNNKYSNNHHHQESDFTEKQMALLEKFFTDQNIEKETKIIDLLLVNLKGRNFKSVKYIEKAYQTLLNEVPTSKVQVQGQKKRTLDEEVLQSWEDEKRKLEDKTEEQKAAELKEIEELKKSVRKKAY